MKKLFFTLLLCLIPSLLFASSVTFTWTANDPAEGVTGYKIHYGPAPGDYSTATIDVGNVTTYTIDPVPVGWAYYAATAYNADGMESGPSIEIKFKPVPVAPKGFYINQVTYKRSE